jgi:hypothetical protein
MAQRPLSARLSEAANELLLAGCLDRSRVASLANGRDGVIG